MLTPVEICEQLTTDEFITLCQLTKPYRFDIVSLRRTTNNNPVVFVQLNNGLRERIEVGMWPISA